MMKEKEGEGGIGAIHSVVFAGRRAEKSPAHHPLLPIQKVGEKKREGGGGAMSMPREKGKRPDFGLVVKRIEEGGRGGGKKPTTQSTPPSLEAEGGQRPLLPPRSPEGGGGGRKGGELVRERRNKQEQASRIPASHRRRGRRVTRVTLIEGSRLCEFASPSS